MGTGTWGIADVIPKYLSPRLGDWHTIPSFKYDLVINV